MIRINRAKLSELSSVERVDERASFLKKSSRNMQAKCGLRNRIRREVISG